MKLLGRPRKNPPLGYDLEDWQQAVNTAQLALTIDAAFAYGLLQNENGSTKSPIKVEHCLTLLRQGKRIGIEPISEL